MSGPFEPSVFIKKIKNCSGSTPLTLATPIFRLAFSAFLRVLLAIFVYVQE
jgi:hypothetical protein